MTTAISPDVRQRLDEIGRMPEVLPQDEWRSHNIQEVQAGGVIKLDARIFLVKERHRYTSGNYVWHELVLFCANDGKTYFLEWEVDDILEVSLTTSQLSLANIGYSAEWLEKVDERESGSLSHGGHSYTYDESDSATFYRNGEGHGEPLYYWDFLSGDRGLTIERWDDKYVVYLWEKVHPGSIEVLRVG